MGRIEWDWNTEEAEIISQFVEPVLLVIRCQKHNPPFTYRRCKTIPTPMQQLMVQAISGGREGVRAFSGERTSSCDNSYYLGWNTVGYQFQKESCYCQCCGYAYSDIKTVKAVIVDRGYVSRDYVKEIERKCEIAGLRMFTIGAQRIGAVINA